MKPKYGDIRHDGRVFTGYSKQLTKKYGVRKYEQWRSLEFLKRNPSSFKKLIAHVEAQQNANQPKNTAINYFIVVLVVILIILCSYAAYQQ